MTHDFEGRFQDVNPALCRVTGYAREELIGRPIHDLMPAQYRPFFRREYLTPLMEQGWVQGVFTVLNRDGEELFVEYRTVMVKKDNQPAYITGVGRDVSERIIAQRELRNMEEQLIQSQKLQAVGTLASGISHDFNNILQAISGYIQLLLSRDDMAAESIRYLNEVDHTVDRASELVKGLLTFSRKVKTQLKPVQLNREVEHTVRLLKRAIPRMIRIETRLAADLPPILGDSGQLEQILMNLGANAKDAMPRGGELIIETETVQLDERSAGQPLEGPRGVCALLRVSDTGVGMDDGTLGHIFEPFFTTKEIGKGTGLGLSMVYGIVRNHGGRIDCRADLGREPFSASFFPAAPDAQVPQARVEPKEETVVGGGETILVVDDEKAILEIVRETLTRGGYRVLAAESGGRGPERFPRRRSARRPGAARPGHARHGGGGLSQGHPRNRPVLAGDHCQRVLSGRNPQRIHRRKRARVHFQTLPAQQSSGQDLPGSQKNATVGHGPGLSGRQRPPPRANRRLWLGRKREREEPAMDSERILVTGATGYVGGRLAPRLMDAGFPIRAAVRSPRKLADRPWAARDECEVVRADVLDRASLAAAARGCRAVVYLVHSMAAAGPAYAQRDREAARNMVRAAEEAGVSRILYLGGLGEELEGLSAHLASRAEVGRILSSGGVRPRFCARP